MTNLDYQVPASARDDDAHVVDVVALLAPAASHWKSVLAAAILGGAVGVGVSYLVPPKFTAVNVFMPPQPPQSSAASTLASLGALSGLAGAAASVKNSPDEYIALMQSATISDRIIKRFDLLKLWDLRFQVDARKRLLKMVNITSGKKDGLMHVEVTDTDPPRAASIANQYVEELRVLTTNFAVTEAQQRRVFFEHLLEQTRDKLTAAQAALGASGFTAGALNAEPSAAATEYARVRAELTAATVRLQVLQRGLSNGSSEVQAQQEAVSALTSELSKVESRDQAHGNSGEYVSRYREFKYQETLFDLFARQYESARVDESREGALIQVLDSATPPERKSAPGRMFYGLVAALLSWLIASGYFVVRSSRKAKALIA